jgi:glucose/arabinose dehydrogenase
MKLRNLLCSAILATSFAGFADAQSIDTTRVTSGLSRPVRVTHAPGDPDRLFIVEKQGRIRVFHIPDDQLRSTYFLNIDSIVGGGTSTSNEQGLLGIAFHPSYESNGYFYVYYTNNSGNTVVARYTVSSNPEVASSSSAYQIITFSQPYSNHNGGEIQFGPDGYLYIGTGDGGSGNDPGNRGQDITNNKLGKILRIDVDGGSPYAIPPGNPFASSSGDDEIYMYGLRNPWCFSFDGETGDMYIGDVGQNAREEINVIAAGSGSGANLGWRCMEGAGCTGLSGCTCNSSSLTDPVYSYNQSSSTGWCVTGGYVYRGCAIEGLEGTYFFADYSSTNIWSFKWNGGTGYTNFSNRNELESSLEGYGVDNISTFGEDYHGEIYICDQSGGELFKIIPASGEVDCTPPLQGDMNGDCLVDGTDLSIVLGFWGQSGPEGDANGDGNVDGGDLSIVLGFWGGEC